MNADAAQAYEQQQQQPGMSQGIADIAGSLGGDYLGRQVGSRIFGSGVPATPAGPIAAMRLPNATSLVPKAPIAGAAAAGAPAATGIDALSNFNIAGAGLSALGLVNSLKGGDPIGSVVSGGGLGLSLAPAFAVGGPVGLLAGAAIGGLGSLLFGQKSRTKIEQKRREALAKQGVTLQDPKTKAWEANQQFHDTRDEKYLKGTDLADAAAFYEKFGPSWQKADANTRAQIAQSAIDKGLVREHHGTIELGDSPELAAAAAQTLPKSTPFSDNPKTFDGFMQWIGGRSGGKK